MIYNLSASNEIDAIQEVEKLTISLRARLMEAFQLTYLVHSQEIEKPDDNGNWSNEIKIRKGNKIGVSISLNWKKSTYKQVEIVITESTKLGSYLLYGIGFPFMFIGAYMGANNIAPLDFLPGYKLAAGLGGAIAFIPGVIIATIIKGIILKKSKEENHQLQNQVTEIVQVVF